jgi:MFS family permease
MKTLLSVKGQWHVFLATWLGEMFDGLDASIMILVMFPALSELLKTSSHSIVAAHGGIIIALFLVGYSVGGIIFGTLADYIGRTKTLVLTILFYSAFTGLCALAHSWQELGLYRFLVGCGIGGEMCIGGVMVAESWHGKSRIHAAAMMTSSFGFGYLFAALLNLFIGPFGWRWLFVAGIIPALLTVYIRSSLKESDQFELVKAHRALLRAKPKSELSEQDKEILGFTLKKIFSRTNANKIMCIVALVVVATVGYWSIAGWIPAWINQLTGTSAINERSTAAIVSNIGAIIAAFGASFLVNWLGRRNAFRFAFAGGLVSAIGMFLSIKIYGPDLLVWVFASGFFSLLPFSLLFIYIPELFDTKIRASAFGFSYQSGRILGAVVAVFSGQLVSFFGGSYAIAGSWVSLIFLVGIAATFFMPESKGIITQTIEVQPNEKNILVASN